MKSAKTMSVKDIKDFLEEADKKSVLVLIALWGKPQRIEKLTLEITDTYLVACKICFNGTRSMPNVYFFDEIQEVKIVPKKEGWVNIYQQSMADIHRLSKNWYYEKQEIQDGVKRILLACGIGNEKRKLFAASKMLEELKNTANLVENPDQFLSLIDKLKKFF